MEEFNGTSHDTHHVSYALLYLTLLCYTAKQLLFVCSKENAELPCQIKKHHTKEGISKKETSQSQVLP